MRKPQEGKKRDQEAGEKRDEDDGEKGDGGAAGGKSRGMRKQREGRVEG